ncbi:MAG: hypothetical protein N3H31_07505 [Candidatus Nezhaarchaeota archaeon]|nr:hypothetical protein [Candidatus Nezhaarchaeota archaeon]
MKVCVQLKEPWQVSRMEKAAALFLVPSPQSPEEFVNITVSDTPPHANIAFLTSVLGGKLTPLLAERGVFGFHGACFADKEDRGFLIVGPGGSGKSTLVFSALSRGYGIVGDDFILHRRDREGITFLPFSAEILLKLDEGLKILRPIERFGRQVFRCVKPSVIVFPRIVDAEHSSIEKISDRFTILKRLVESSVWVNDKKLLEEEALRLKELCRLPTYSLLLGRDHRRSPDIALSLMEGLTP